MRARIVDQPKHSNVKPGGLYKVVKDGNEYRVSNIDAALFIDPRDIKRIVK